MNRCSKKKRESGTGWPYEQQNNAWSSGQRHASVVDGVRGDESGEGGATKVVTKTAVNESRIETADSAATYQAD